MFYFSRLFLGPLGGLISAVAYMYLPYRIVNLYVRGDLAEAFAMSILPWVFCFLYTTFSGKGWWHTIALSLSCGVLVFTHNCTALTASGLIILFLLYLALSDRNVTGLLRGALGLLLGWGLSAVFWLPALLEKNLVHIELIHNNPAFDFHNNFVEPYRLFSPLWSLNAGIGGRELPLQIGAPHVLLTLVSVIALWRFRHQTSRSAKQVGLFFLLSALLLVFLMQPSSTLVWENLFLLPYIQFPWRLLALLGFACSFLAGGIFVVFHSTEKALPQMVQLALMVVMVLTGAQYCYVRGYYILDEEAMTPTFVREQWSTASSYNTKEMAHVQDFGEYLPTTVKRVPDRKKAGAILVTSGKAVVTERQRTLQGYAFEAVVEEEVEIVVGSFYYPSWTAKANGKATPLFTDEEGLIHLGLPKGPHRVDVVFGPSFARILAAYVSLGSIAGMIGLAVAGYRQRRRETLQQA
jgi:hypothetical protein